jgi:hypothetical protein
MPPTKMNTCIRCGVLAPESQMDIVGNGHRCPSCSLAAEMDERKGIDDIDDNQEPALLQRQARRTRRNWLLTMATVATLAVLAPAYLVISGGYITAALLAGTTLYFGATAIESTYAAYRRYKHVHELPQARVRLLRDRSD